ncbi:MAG: hypothetical protein IPI73_31035 [Betaproteobacteria bacterium]|nr:hypothetical protein [Betaproteobacteria bacterium]
MINIARQDCDTATTFAVIPFIILAVYLADRLAFAPLGGTRRGTSGGSKQRTHA